jgi:hypothetical protein
MCPKDVPATVMVFGVVSSEGDLMPPNIFETGLRVNTDIYLEVMESTVLPWIKTVAGDRPWVWQQDSAPCHVSNKSIQWLKDTAMTWSRRTAGLQAVLILIQWTILCEGYLETHTNQRAHTTKASLITSIKENFASMDKAMVVKACAAFKNLLSVFYFK